MISIVTDHGADNLFMSVVKGNLMTLTSEPIIEVSGSIAVGDVHAASHITERLACHLPKETICVTIVDGSNESSRKPLVLKTKDDRYFVGFDNGVFTMAIERFGIKQIRQIDLPMTKHTISFTRSVVDFLLPVTSRLLKGDRFEDIGELNMTFYDLKHKHPSARDKTVAGEVAFTNSLGDVATNIPFEYLKETGANREDTLKANGRDVLVTIDRRDVAHGELIICEGLGGYAEILANGARADSILRVSARSPLTLEVQ